MNAQTIPSSLKANPHVRIVEHVLICDRAGRRHRGKTALAHDTISEMQTVRAAARRPLRRHLRQQRRQPLFFETHSDDEGQTWSPMPQLNFRGDSPSVIRLSSGALLAALRLLPEQSPVGIGLVASSDEGQIWELLGNIHDQTN